ncbi:MAG TPA: endonuclease V [Candidatus Bathyarchaeia archaeon]|nr:endonuclease V [Candidatus Bathyarchaeia archaeon]
MDTATAATISKFSVSKAHKAQTYLSKKIIQEDRLPDKINLVAGVDVAYAGELAIGAVAVLDYESLELLELQTATCRVKFPYIPTLLSFREIPPAVACIRRLKQQPDVFLADGQGVAHPYRCGFASHLGLAIGKPTIGVAKSRLIGKPTEIGRDVFLVENDQIIGSVVTTKESAKPVYVSVGHLISLETATKIVKHCVRNSRIPEPLLQAHKTASKERNLQKT